MEALRRSGLQVQTLRSRALFSARQAAAMVTGSRRDIWTVG